MARSRQGYWSKDVCQLTCIECHSVMYVCMCVCVYKYIYIYKHSTISFIYIIIVHECCNSNRSLKGDGRWERTSWRNANITGVPGDSYTIPTVCMGLTIHIRTTTACILLCSWTEKCTYSFKQRWQFHHLTFNCWDILLSKYNIWGMHYTQNPRCVSCRP